MPTRQFRGKTVDEATDLALETLDLNREEVEIVVVNPGRSGILGFGGEPAEIQVTPVEDVDEEILQGGEAPSDDSGDSELDRDQEDRPASSRGPGRGGRGRGRGRSRGGRGRRGSGPDDSRSRQNGSPSGESDAPSATEDAPPAIRQAMREDATSERADGADGDSEGAADLQDAQWDGDESGGEPDEARPRRREQRVHTPGPDPEVEPIAAEVLDYFLSVMDVSVATYVSEDSDDCDVAFEIEGEDSGLLIGRRGETLQSL